jgi:hypothetical protein
MRREMGLEVTDRIELVLQTTPRVQSCYETYKEYITGETLTVKTTLGPCAGTAWDLNGEETVIFIQKA